jgi:hypothetical protein
MKNLFTLLVFIAFAGINNSQASERINVVPTAVELAEISEMQNTYAATAYTRRGYGQEYSINITIHGNSTSYSSTITKVVCNGSSVSYSRDYNNANTYYFSYDGETYYFTF